MVRSSKFPDKRDIIATGNQGGGEIRQDAYQVPDGQNFGLQLVLDSGDTIVIKSLPASIGRSEQNDIRLKNDTVSSTHARIYYEDLVRNICIVDIDSLNGLFINEQPSRKNLLFDGAKIRIGNVNLTFRDTGYIHSG